MNDQHAANDPAAFARAGETGPMRIDLILASSCFVLTARLGDYEKSAEALNIRASALKMHIGDLEELLSARLLADADGFIRPTEIGAELIAPLTAAVVAAAAEDPRISEMPLMLLLPEYD